MWHILQEELYLGCHGIAHEKSCDVLWNETADLIGTHAQEKGAFLNNDTDTAVAVTA